MKCWIVVCLPFFIYTAAAAQEIRYDTTYQVNYENGIKDSVIVISKRVIVSEKYYVVDSNETYGWAIAPHIDPFIISSTLKSSYFNSPEIFHHSREEVHRGQSVGLTCYKTGEKMDIRFGINVSRLVLKLKSKRDIYSLHPVSYLENDTLDTYYTVDDAGHITYYHIIETQEKTRVDTSMETQFNSVAGKFYYAQLVLQAAYKKRIKNWNVSILAGPVIDILIFSKGNSLNEKGDIIASSDLRIHKPIVNIQLNLQTGYHLSGRTLFFIEPYFQKFLFSFNKENSSIFSRNYIGIRTGLKFSL